MEKACAEEEVGSRADRHEAATCRGAAKSGQEHCGSLLGCWSVLRLHSLLANSINGAAMRVIAYPSVSDTAPCRVFRCSWVSVNSPRVVSVSFPKVLQLPIFYFSSPCQIVHKCAPQARLIASIQRKWT